MTIGRQLAAALGAGACAAALVACGSSSPSSISAGTGTNATGYASPVNMSRCMRANGLKNFPDPTQGSGGLGFNGIIRLPDGLQVDGITFDGPAAQKALKACSPYFQAKGPPP